MSKNTNLDSVFRVLVVIFSAIIYSIGLMWFLEPVGLYSGGVSGISQIFNRVFYATLNVNIPIGVWLVLINLPIFIIGMKYVSKRFAYFSILSVVFQSILMMGFLPTLNIQDGADPLFYSIVGGIAIGLGSGIALRYGTSTGGIDIISQSLALHKGISIAMISFSFNFFIAVVGGGLIDGDINIILYTFIRIIITALVLDKVHNQYNFIGIRIMLEPEKSQTLADILLKELGRGITLYNCKGGYTRKDRVELFLVISTYEFPKIHEIVDKHDSTAFLVATPVKKVYGNFKRRSIV